MFQYYSLEYTMDQIVTEHLNNFNTQILPNITN